MSRLSYAELLRDPRWQKKRLAVFQKSGFKLNNQPDAEFRVINPKGRTKKHGGK